MKLQNFATVKPKRRKYRQPKHLVKLWSRLYELQTGQTHPLSVGGKTSSLSKLWGREVYGINQLKKNLSMTHDDIKRMIIWFWLKVVPGLRSIPGSTLVLQKFYGHYTAWKRNHPYQTDDEFIAAVSHVANPEVKKALEALYADQTS